MPEKFINPYTFVPLPGASPRRGRPHGHCGDPALLSGILRVKISAVMPLLIRSVTASGEGEGPTGLPARPDGTTIIPGSTLKGALRSLHETVAGGCFRVFDDGFVPVYRQLTSAGSGKRLRLAVVTRHNDVNEPPAVQLCDSNGRKVPQHLLMSHHGPPGMPWRSGHRVRPSFGKKGKVTAIQYDPNGEWVLYLSDPGGRNRDSEKPAPYRGYIAKLTGQSADVPAHVWEQYRAALRGADDLRPGKQPDDTEDKRFVDVMIPAISQGGDKSPIRIGQRYRASEELDIGQPVWVRTDEHDQIRELRLAQIWRERPDTAAAGERVGAFTPCDTYESLCPSCQLFGAVDPVGEHEAAEQRAYQGHVRFGDAHATGPVATCEVTLPPMGTPHPGAGQFYLENDALVRGNADRHPLARWGSPADKPQPRRLRGRKYYWHTPTDDGKPTCRGQARCHQHESGSEMVSAASVLPAGTVLTSEITFTDVSPAQLGGLLAVLEPDTLLEGDGLLHHIGGGKPLGYGSCRIAIDQERSRIWYSGTRYGAGGQATGVPSRDELVAAFRESTEHGVREQWVNVRRALDPASVDQNLVWYPPGASWDDQGTATFDQGFPFWKHTSGEEVKEEKGKETAAKNDQPRRDHPLIPLPQISESEQTLPIVAEATDLEPQQPLDGGSP
ncbi:TIGR03986 family CRISPR-associated RAMP protein [Haloechinothrix sp. LS1_15]|uniref:TIGR03986 family type III CRISPR-associated RAMP protein n=1 Tax=Haloechinothrix sp. LS1_15 TaxID=2652248 RepID=UPI00294B5997|nr:TIGR03986 family CRISPR-associated RAMP protein [Haloechinothrix sp. LS1_15]